MQSVIAFLGITPQYAAVAASVLGVILVSVIFRYGMGVRRG